MKTIQVSPDILEQAADAYCADKIGCTKRGQLPKVPAFALGAMLLMTTGVHWKDGVPTVFADELVLEADYHGPPFERINPETGYTGMKVSFKGRTFIANQVVRIEGAVLTQTQTEQLQLI